jgi:rhodanese-related sulfurtransferase/DNA-binding transcriptional ArsR family regulator
MKSRLYEQVARIGKAMSAPKRLELIDLLVQGERSVEALADDAGIDIRLVSAHLRTLREARLVETRRDGKRIYYRLSGDDVARLWIAIRRTAEDHLAELRLALNAMAAQPEELNPESRENLLEKARQGEVVVIDVRPPGEFEAGHLPFARSMPLPELVDRLCELPRDRDIVAYCRGPYCLLSEDAVALLSAQGFRVRRIADGVREWAAAGLPLERTKGAA